MLIFGITTTTKTASICLYEESKGIVSEITLDVAKTHSTTIIEQIDRMLEWSSKKLEDIGKVIVSVGPGSFTGVRIAIAVVKGMFFGRDVEIYEVNEIDALAFQAARISKSSNELDNTVILSMIDANKEKLYCGKYVIGNNDFNINLVEDREVIKLDDLLIYINSKINECNTKYIFVGDAAQKYKNKIIENVNNENLTIIDEYNSKIRATTFVHMYNNGILKNVNINNIKPYYLEKSQAEKEKEVK